MSKQNYCLTPEEEHYAKACLTLAKRWGLIDDDSFSALDYQTDAALRQALAKQTHDATVIIVAQRLSTILHADQILVLDGGRIVGRGTHSALLRSCETYREIALSQLSAAELGEEG